MKSPLLASLLLVHFYLDASTEKHQRTLAKKQKDTKQATASTVITLTKDALDATLSANLAFVLVGSEWCTWCKKMKPIFEESFKAEKERATYAYLALGKSFNTNDLDPALKHIEKTYGIQIKVIPTILVFKNKKLVEHIPGSHTKEQLAALVKKHSTPTSPVSQTEKSEQSKKTKAQKK